MIISWACDSCDGKDCDHVPLLLTPADQVIPARGRRADWVAWEPEEEDRHG